jgi:hypothetical protein
MLTTAGWPEIVMQAPAAQLPPAYRGAGRRGRVGRAALTEPIELSRRQVKTALDLLLAAIERKPGTIPVVHIRRRQALDMRSPDTTPRSKPTSKRP